MSGGHRSMKVVHGRVVTRRRWRVIRAYMEKRRDYYEQHRIGPHNHWGKYGEWANDFERFMLYGFAETGPRQLAPPSDGARLLQQTPGQHKARVVHPRVSRVDLGI